MSVRQLPCRSSWILLPLLLLGTGCTSGVTSATPKIAVIPKGTSHEFWKSIHAGAEKARQEVGGFEVVWRGPERENDKSQQVDLVQNFVASGISAIVIAPADDRALASPISVANQGGTPVIVIDSGVQGVAGTDYASYIATDNVEGGRIAGRRIAELTGGKGRVLVLRYQQGSGSTTQREQGFVEVLESFEAIEVVDPGRYAGSTRESARQAAENLLEADSDYAGIFCSNESATFGMLLALRARALAGKVFLVGFDASDGLVEGMRAGEIHGLVVQDPVAMGELGVKTALAVLRGEKVETLVDTGAKLVTGENIDEPQIVDLLTPPLKKYLGE
ncbi:MAG: substrate-binding domain-containing protein [Planctomycetota bacterium]|nr:substrate-binding domain-containing protein [Planctomycetota bacterium]